MRALNMDTCHMSHGNAMHGTLCLSLSRVGEVFVAETSWEEKRHTDSKHLMKRIAHNWALNVENDVMLMTDNINSSVCYVTHEIILEAGKVID